MMLKEHSWDTFGTIEGRDIARNSRYRLQMEELRPSPYWRWALFSIIV